MMIMYFLLRRKFCHIQKWVVRKKIMSEISPMSSAASIGSRKFPGLRKIYSRDSQPLVRGPVMVHRSFGTKLQWDIVKKRA